MAFSYRTIAAPTQGLYREKGSKFLSFAFPVATEQQVKEILLRLQKNYHDASHHCYAWILGTTTRTSKAFDDGEPNHSAGDPILGQIRSREITNTLVVVVRYFGGTKLGVGGLISAYKAAAAEALTIAIIEERKIVKRIAIVYDYPSTPVVMKLVKDFDLTILNQQFNDACSLEATYEIEFEESLFEKIALLQNTGTALKISKDQ